MSVPFREPGIWQNARLTISGSIVEPLCFERTRDWRNAPPRRWNRAGGGTEGEARTLAVPRDGCSQDGEAHKTLLGAVGLEKSFVLDEVPRGARASWMKLADHVKDAKHAPWDHGGAKSLSHRRRGNVEPVARHLSDTRGLVGSAVQRPSWEDSAPERSGNTGIPVTLSSVEHAALRVGDAR